MNFPSISEITEKAQHAFQRFPLTLTWSVLGTLFTMALLEGPSIRLEYNSDILLTLIIGISWLIGLQFFIEQREAPKKWFWLKIVLLVALFGFYWYLPDDGKDVDQNPEYLIRFALFFIAGHLFVLFAPFLKHFNKVAYWNYLKSIGVAITRSALFSGVLFLGLVLAMAAVDALFDAHIRGERYGQLFIFCLGVVNTWIYLSDFPRNVVENIDINFNKALEVLVKYILIPLVILYTLILYAYGLKIVLEWELPKGWVSYLVTVLAFLGFTVQVIINPVQKRVSSWAITNFYPWFYYLLLPLVLLLFVAIFRRVADYGITENRYFVMVLAVWILAIALYKLLAKKQRLIVMPISLFLLVLAASFGPWGALSVSKKSQLRQFKELYDTAQAQDKLLPYKKFEQLKSIITYLDDRKSISALDPITGIAMEAAFKDTTQGKYAYYGWMDTAKVMDSLGIKINPDDIPKPGHAMGNYYNYYNNQRQSYTYDLEDFNHLTVFHLDKNNRDKKSIGDFLISYNEQDKNIRLLTQLDSVTVLEIPLKDKLMRLSKNGPNLYDLNETEMTFFTANDSLKTKLIFKNIDFFIDKDSISINYARAFIFLQKLK